jgi:uncharacterized protein
MRAFLVVIFLCTSSIVKGQDKSSAPPPQTTTSQSAPAATPQGDDKKIDATKEADIRKLLDLTGATTNMRQAILNMEKSIKPLMTNSLPPGEYREKLIDLFFQKFQAKLDLQKLIDLAVPEYDKHFSDDDIKEMIRFYQTPVGQKAVKAIPELTAAIAAASQQEGQQVGRQCMLEVLAEHPEFEEAIRDATKSNQP